MAAERWPFTPGRERLTGAQIRYELRELTLARQGLVRVHLAGWHDVDRRPGCPYCFPPGPNSDYMPREETHAND